MLVLSRVNDSYPDDVDSTLRYQLPTGLEPLTAADGVPEAIITRSADSGLLHIRLAATWPELKPGERKVSFAGGRFRLVLHTPALTENGQWRSIMPGNDDLVDRSIKLDTVEMAITRRLGESADDIVDIEVELDVKGLMPVFPWLVRANFNNLKERISTLIGTTPASWEDVSNAFLGLDREIFSWHPVEAGAIPPPKDDALLAIAQHAATHLLSKTVDGWIINNSGPEHLDISLDTARIEKHTIGMRWSFSDFLNMQPDPGKHLIDISTPAPFEAARLHIANDLPLHTGGIRSISVEVVTGGPSGRLHHKFLPGEASTTSLDFIRETFNELDIRWRGRMVVMTSTGSTLVETPWRRSDMLIELNSSTTGLHALRFNADISVFEHIDKLHITVGRRTLTLDASISEAWAVGRTIPDKIPVSAVLATGQKHSIGEMPPGAHGLTIGPADLGIGEITAVTLKASDAVLSHTAYLAVQVENGSWRTIEPDTQVIWPTRRMNRFVPPQLRYRTRQVKRDSDGATHVMSQSDWHQASGNDIDIET